MTDQEQINALKAQVNCLYEVLDKSRLLSKAKTAPEMRRIEQEIRELLSRTPEQCLAEVKAKAIRTMQKELETFGAVFNDGNGEDWHEVIKHSDVVTYVFKLQEQAK